MTHTNGTNGTSPHTNLEWAHIPAGSWTRKLRVVSIGAGFTGVNMAYYMQKFLPNEVEHVVYEKNVDVGGTWLENRYAGCACDVPSHIYQLTWAPNPKWTKYYSSAQEIHSYISNTVKSHQLSRFIKLEHEVQSAVWDEKMSKWKVTVKTPSGTILNEEADVLINGSGILNNWKWPTIPGLDTFKGDKMHSAKWDEKYDFKDKSVAIVGSGSSGVQIVAALEPIVSSMKVFIRSPIWVTPSIASQFAGPDGQNFSYTPEAIAKLEDSPAEYKKYMQQLDGAVSEFTAAFYNDAPEQKIFKEFASQDMLKRLGGNEKLAEKIIPTFPLGCRRPTPGNGFLEALVAPKVEPVTVAIERIDEKGIILTSGRHIEADVIICATGFDVSLKPRFPIVGRKGDLKDQWAKIPEGYMGVTVENLPNYFVSLGPSSPVAHGSLVPVIERISHYIIKAIHHLASDASIASMTPRADAVKEFNEWRREPLKQLVWTANCRSWFKNGDADADPFAVHPGSRAHYVDMIANPRWQDYDYTYTNNRFAYLGNGKAEREAKGQPITEHLDEPDALW